MTMKQTVLAGVMLASSALTACASQAYVAYQVPPPPAPLAVGAVGYAPGPGYVWADGFWDLRGGRWVWATGGWRRAPHARAVWVRPYWEPHGRSWRFHRGYWR
jgi:YXWGXW repeat-containing protein